jgi:hypothetical protein
VILQTLNERVQVVQKYMLSLPSSRVQIVGSKFDDDCREIRTFLSLNRIPYEWADRDRSAHLAPTDQACEVAGLSVVVDGSFCVSDPPTVRKVAEALRPNAFPDGRRPKIPAATRLEVSHPRASLQREHRGFHRRTVARHCSRSSSLRIPSTLLGPASG